jgi:hypothetical protein
MKLGDSFVKRQWIQSGLEQIMIECNLTECLTLLDTYFVKCFKYKSIQNFKIFELYIMFEYKLSFHVMQMANGKVIG